MTNLIIRVYKDAQNQQSYLGAAIIKPDVQKISRPFIINEEKETHQRIYRLDYYEVDRWIYLTNLGLSYVHKEKKIFPVRVLDRIGISVDNHLSVTETEKPVDKFLTIHGQSVF